MAMNKQRRTSSINNIVVYDALGNVILPASLTVKGFTTAGFVKTDVNGLLSVDTGAYLPMPSQTGNAGKYLTTNGSVLSWGTISTANIYNSDGTLTGNRTVTLGSNSLTFLKTIAVVTNAEGVDIKNDTVSTVSNNSYSPSLTFSAFGWGGTSANTLSRIRQYLVPVSGSPWNLPTLKWDGFNAYGDWVNLMTLKSYGFGGGEPYGGLTIGNTITGYININVTRGQIDNGSNSGQLVFVNTNGNGGIKLQGAGQYIEMKGSTGISFHNGTSEMGRFYTATGNLLIQTGGTFTDAGYKLDVQGTGRVSGNTYLNSSVYIGSGGPASGLKITENDIAKHYYDATSVGIRFINDNRFILYGGKSPGFPVDAYNIVSVNGGNSTAHIFGTHTDGAEILSALVEIKSTTKGFLQPRMTTTQRDAIATPATGLQVYNTTTNVNNVYNGTAWVAVGGATPAGSNTQIQYNNSGAFGASANLVWDDTNKRLSIGTATNSGQTLTLWGQNEGAIVCQNNTSGTGLYKGFYFGTLLSENYIWAYQNQPILFGTYGTERMRLTASGRLLLGTTTESTYLLDVNGTARVSGDMRINSITVGRGANNDVSNTAFGFGSLGMSSASALNNTAMGVYCLQSNTSGLQNTAIGAAAGAGNVSGVSNVYIGFNAGVLATSSSNTLVGTSAGSQLTTGGGNIFIGYLSGFDVTTGSNNTIIGRYIYASTVSAALSNNIILGDGSGNMRLVIDNNGNAVLGGSTTYPTFAGYKLDVAGTGRFTNTLSVITTGTTNDVALFKSTEPYITIEAAGGSNPASIFLKPSTSAQNATIQNRTGGGLEFYTGAIPSLAATITSANNLVVGTVTAATQKLQVSSISADSHFLVWGSTAPSIRIDNAASGATQRFVFGLATATNNFITGSVAGDVCMTTQSSNPLLFGANSTEVMRITTTSNLLIGTATDAGYKLDVNGTARIQLPLVGTSSYFVLSSASATAFSSYFGVTGSDFTFSKGEYSWGTNLKFNGTTFVRDNTGVGSWMISQSCGNDVANHFFRIRNFNPIGTLNSSAFVIGGSGIVGINREPVSGVGLSVSGTIGGDGLIIDQSVSRYVLGLSSGALRLTLNDAALPVFQIANSSSTAIVFNSTNSYASAQLAIDSTTRGFLPPRMTTTQKNAISAPVAGLMVYDTTLNKLCVYTTTWETITSV